MSAPGSKLPSGSPSLPLPLSPLRMPDDAAVLDEQLVRRCLGQHECAGRLGLLGEVSGHLRDRDDPVAVVAESRGRRNPERALPREEVDALARNLAVGRKPFDLVRSAAKQATHGPRVHDGARQKMRSGLFPLVDECDRNLTELLGGFGILLQELPETERAREPGGTAADDQDADVDPRVWRIRRPGDDLVTRERWWEVRRASLDGRSAPAHATPCAPARALRASGRSCSGRRRRRSRQSRRWAHSRPC